MSIKDNVSAKIAARWNSMDGNQRQRAIQVSVVVVGIVVIGSLYYLTGQDAKRPPPPPPSVSSIKVGEGRLEDDIRATVDKQRIATQQQQEATDKRIEAQDNQLKQIDQQTKAIQQALEQVAKLKTNPDGSGVANPPQWPDQWSNAPVPPAGSTGFAASTAPPPGPPAPPAPRERIGGIGSLGPQPGLDVSKKNNPHRWFLPVGFMPAKLLTGLKAKTVETARNNPEPMLLRVQAPAVLPNEVRAELSGCFVIANGFGSLAAERVEASLVSLSCVDFAGNSLIEANVRGIIVDSDGVKGLAGHVVSKAGTNLARAVIAGAFQGAGQALASSSTTQSVSGLGTTTTINPNAVGQAALGAGLSNGANELAKVYLDLVKQAAPVVEHGPDTDCSIVLTEGVWLEVKAYEDGTE